MRYIARLTAPYFYRRDGQERYLRFLDEVEQNQWKTPAQLLDVQRRKLSTLLAHALRSVPYYKHVLDKQGITAASVRPDDLSRFPLLTKGLIQQHGADLITAGLAPEQLIKKGSSGSTGQPTTVYFDQARADWSWAYNTRHNRWAGFDWGDKVGSVWGLGSHIVSRDDRNWYKNALSDAKDILTGRTREIWTHPYHLRDAELAVFARRLVKFRPHILIGYSNSLRTLAEYVLGHGINGIQPRGVISGGETLDPETRQLVEHAFGSRVFNRYGTRELDIIASECERGHLHVNDDNLIVELVDTTSTGAGRVVVTDLNNFAMPLIRYDVEDYATRETDQCECGRGLSMLRSLDGRRVEMLKTEAGEMIPGTIFFTLIRQIAGVTSFQVRQRETRHFEIRVVTSSDAPLDDYLAPAVDTIRTRFGRDCVVDLFRVDNIPRVGTGKYRFVIGDVK